MAQAVTDLFPGAKYAIGPAIDDGFYYDFELPDGAHFSDDDLERIEARMREIVAGRRAVRARGGRPATRRSRCSPTSRTSGRSSSGSTRATSEIGDGNVISVYRNPRPTAASSSTCAGARTCRRPSGSARSSSRRSPGPTGAATRSGPMLQRIYGTAWESKAALEEHLHRLEEAEKRDHRKLGAELDLFSFPEEIGSGLAVFHPKGGIVRKIMEDYSRQRHEAGRVLVRQLAAHHQGEPVRDLGPPRLVRRRHVPADGARRRHRVLPQADELPVPHPDLPEPDALVPRAAAAVLRVRHRLPLREVGRGARPHPRARA